MKKLSWLFCFMPFAAALAANGSSDRAAQPQARVELAKQIRIRQVVGLSEALELTEADSLRMAQIIRSFQERRRPLQELVNTSARMIRRAAAGDADSVAQVDHAIQEMYAARAQIAELNKEMFGVLGQGLSPQQRAKMAVFFAKFENQLRDSLAKRARRLAQGAEASSDKQGQSELDGTDPLDLK